MRLVVFVGLLFLGACRVGGVEVLSINGDAPRVIAVWPLAMGAKPAGDEMWFTGLASALARRGYRVIPPGVATELLRESDLTVSAADEVGIGRALRADALLRFEVREFSAQGSVAMRHAEWDVEWSLLSTRGHGEQWSFVHHGYWRQVDGDPFDPTRSLDRHAQPREITPIGGVGGPNFRDPKELLAYLHEGAMSRLPKRIP